MGTISASPAVSGSVVPGVSFPPPAQSTSSITAHVVDRDTPSVSLGTLPDSFARQWREELSEPGAGSLQMENDDSALSLIGDDRLIRFDVDGLAKFLMLPKERRQVTIAAGEEYDEVTTIEGPGHLAVLAEALVYPSRGVDSLPIEDDRVFSWPSPDYDSSGWPSATQIVAQSSSTEWWEGLPSDSWPDPGAYWIWAHQGSEVTAPEGTCYFRREFTLSAAKTVIIYFTSDDSGIVFVDGMRMDELDVGLRTVQAGPNQIRTASIKLSAGDHVIGVQVYNAPPNPADTPGTTNPAGFLLAVYEIDDLGAVSGQVLNSDSSFVVAEYPPTPPGMTPGEAVRIVLTEASTRGAIPTVARAFTDDVDSNGNPWPVVGDIATKVGTDVLTFLREMSGTYFDMRMAPAGFELHLFALGEQGNATSITFHGPTDPTDPATSNLAGLVHRRVT